MVARINRTTAAVVAGVAASLIFGGSPAIGQGAEIIIQAPSANVRGERVTYQDLNLASRDGEKALVLRVSNAVERVCLGDEGRWYGMTQPDYLTCTERAWRGARPQVIGAVFRARQFAYRQR